MEIEDSNFKLLSNIIVTTDVQEAVSGVDIVILIGGYPRLPGMERKDLLLKNASSVSVFFSILYEIFLIVAS